MLYISDEAAIKLSNNNVVLRESLDRINKKIQKYQKEQLYNESVKSNLEYQNLLMLQREAKIKLKKTMKPQF